MSIESRHKVICMSLNTYYGHKTEFDNWPDDKERFVIVRTNFNGQELIGWVERERLAQLLEATSEAAYMGYDTIDDPDIPQEGYRIPYDKRVYEAIRNVIEKRHKESGKRPGERISQDNPLSFDKCALLIALSGE